MKKYTLCRLLFKGKYFLAKVSLKLVMQINVLREKFYDFGFIDCSKIKKNRDKYISAIKLSKNPYGKIFKL